MESYARKPEETIPPLPSPNSENPRVKFIEELKNSGRLYEIDFEDLEKEFDKYRHRQISN